MAWSRQARQAAALARKRKGGARSHVKYSIVGKHPGSNHKQFKSRAKKVAKYTAVGAGVAAVGAGIYKGAEISSRAKATGTTKRGIVKHRSQARGQNKRAYQELKGNAKSHYKNKQINRKQYKKIKKRVGSQYSYRRRF
jgi:hypothetical protein